MEARYRVETHQFYEAGPSIMNNLGKKRLEWDLNDWKWDGDLFLATPLNANPLECRNNHFPNGNNSSLCSEETDFGIVGKGKGVAEKRRKVIVVEEDGTYNNDGDGSLTLNLVGNWDGGNEKMGNIQGGSSSSRLPCCQVEGCRADLRDSKVYHRRHKVCEMHAKASLAAVNGARQRFCQQCSRFHLLQEFDEGKRSCRQRLAGHNRRRRKTLPDAAANVNPMIDGQATSYLLISLLQILSNLQSDSSDRSRDQDLLSHLLKSLATLAGSFEVENLSRLLHASQDSQRLRTSAVTSSEVPNGLFPNDVPAQVSTSKLPSTPTTTCATPSLRPNNHSACVTAAAVGTPSRKHHTEASLASTVERVKLKEFDLNNANSDAENCYEVNENSVSPAYLGTGSPISPTCLLQDSRQSSPPHNSGNSDSTFAQSQSTLNGYAQNQTGRIVFKLFGKDPTDFPLLLRSQILDWLSHSPTDIESYIRPGCVILTIYLDLAESAWDELCSDLSSNLNSLLKNSADNFWKTGWIYARIQHHISFIYNGKILLSTPRLLGSPCHFKIVSVSPIAAAISSMVNFTVKGLNLAHSSGRLLCALEGQYLVQETTQDLVEAGREHEDSVCLSFSCSLPNIPGRGFIEVEDDGLSSCFFPFIVAENDVCSEIRKLETLMDVASFEDEFQERINPMSTRTQAFKFLNEMGWLLRRSQLRFTSKQLNTHLIGFSVSRFQWLLTFVMDQEWCAVVRNLLDLLFQGAIDTGGVSPDDLALSEGLLHTAVRKNSRLMVEFLLRYRPDDCDSFLFRPDVAGPSNITPLHIAASVSGAEGVLDALTDDPGQFGLKAWRTARDITGFTADDYARSRGNESYLHLVQKKIEKQLNNSDHVVLDIPISSSDMSKLCKLPAFEIEKGKSVNCNLCSQQMIRHTPISRSLLYRPAMLSMVGIAAVCVCISLLFKGPPEVSCVFPPFRWERLSYGSM